MNEQHLKDREENQQLTNLYKVINSLLKKILNVAYATYIMPIKNILHSLCYWRVALTFFSLFRNKTGKKHFLK